MRSKEEYYQSVLKNRELARDPEVLRCTCPNYKCDWHGRCRECIALHRYHQDHIPSCLQPMLREKVKDLVKVVEFTVTEKEKTPDEYREYVGERDKSNPNKTSS